MVMKSSSLTTTSTETGLSGVVRWVGYLALTVVALGACSPHASEQELLDRARVAIERGNARAAEIDAKTALQQNPDNALARRLLGESYLFQQNPATAAEEFQRALDVGEDDEVLVLYARALLSAGRGEQLLELHEQNRFASVSDDPHYLSAFARAQAEEGDLESARQSMDSALSAAPDAPYVTTSNAFLLMVYSQDPVEARQYLEDTVALHPEYVDAWSLLGGIQQMNGEFADAEDSFARAVELNPYRFVDRLNLVTVRLDQGKTEAAKTELQRLLASNPDHPGVNFLQGRMLVEAGDHAEALAAFFKVLNVLPDHPGSLYLSAVANIAEGNLATALDQLNRFLAVQRDNLSGHLLLSNLHLLMDDPQAAENVARDILQYDDANYPAMALLATALHAQGKSGTETIDLYQRMAEARPEAVEPRLALGSALLQAGDGAAGVAQFQAVREMVPDSSLMRETLIQAQLSSGDVAAARAEAEAYAEQQPRNPRPSIYLARIALQENDIPGARAHFGEAEERLRKALGEQPDNVELQKLLIDALMGQGKLEEAGALLAELPADAAREPAVLVARGRIALAGGNPAEAESHLRSAMQDAPASLTLLWLAGALEAQGRDDEAIMLLDDWLAANPADVLVRNQLAASYLQLGREPEAREQYQKVVESLPDNVLVLNNLAWLLRGDDPQQALVHIQKADGLVPRNPQIMDTYAMVQLELGARSEALSLNQRALDLAPGNPEFLYHRAMILQADGQREEAIRILEELVDAEDPVQREEAQILLAELQDL